MTDSAEHHHADHGATDSASANHSRRLIVAINPAASFGKNKDVGSLVTEALRAQGHQVRTLIGASYAELIEKVDSAISSGTDGVVVVGGDGMVHLAVNAVVGTQIPFGIVPAGTGNDAARALGLDEKNPTRAISKLLDSLNSPKAVDAIRIESSAGRVWALGVLSAGFDALVNARANQMTFPAGPIRYKVAMALELARLRSLRYWITADGVSESVDSVIFAVANGTSIGGGIVITPDAELDDGWLDVFVVSPLSRLKFILLFPRVFSGKHLTHPKVRLQRVREVTIDGPDLMAYADGEPVGPLPVTVKIEPRALRVFA